MDRAQAMQEELQQSIVLSEGDIDSVEDGVVNMEVDGDSEDTSEGRDITVSHRHKSRIAQSRRKNSDMDEPNASEDESVEDDDDESERDDDEDDNEDASMGEDDADGEEDDEPLTQNRTSQDDEEEEEDDAEGVGAVKIRPGDTDEEESDDSASIASAASSDHESEAEWETAAGNDEEDDDEEEEAAAETNLCLFCQKPEEDDPSDEFEPYLCCRRCGEYAHQQCSRENGGMEVIPGSSKWSCPDCADMMADPDAEEQAEDAIVSHENDDNTASGAAPGDNVATPDHSITGSSRALRKRKGSEEPAEDDSMILRKRHRSTPEKTSQDGTQDDSIADGSVRPRSVRSVRLKATSTITPCQVIEKSRTTMLLSIRVNSKELTKILSKKPKSQKKRSHRPAANRAQQPNGATTLEVLPVSMLGPSYSQPFYSFYDKETDELKGKPYGGILTEQEADTSKTLPTKDDRRRFDEAKQKAEEEWRNRLLAMQAEAEMQPVKKTKKTQGPASQIECIEFGGWEIDTWYAAPYPEEYSRNRVLYICEFCLKYMNSDYVAWRHKLKCPAKHPPGDEIYRQGSISFFEVDGRKNPVYCQNLCLLAKLFLGSKTLYYDVEPFLFYVLCEYDDLGYHFVGYFSKEKRASSQNNVSCILTLPIHQRKGYGNLLIDFSYLLTKVEEKTGSPEKPLSDMGLVSYRNYWRLVMCKYLLEATPEDRMARKGLSIRQISDDTGMVPDDVVSALEGLRCLVRDPISGLYAFRVDFAYCRQYVEKWDSKGYVKLNPNALTWTPYVMGRSNATNFELGPAISTIAPREDDDDIKTTAVQVLANNGIATGDFTLPLGGRKSVTDLASGVLESTEPNDNNAMNPDIEVMNGLSTTENGDENLLHAHSSMGSSNISSEEKQAEQWDKAYEDVPIHRFVVFPPVNPRRPTVPRLASTAIRPALPRAPSSVSRPRPRPRRPSGATPRPRKSSSNSKKSSSSKRKSGGTGRGPGRWPKGTKKSDYGNADSGPGLPPAWLEKQRSSIGNGDSFAQDTVNVSTPDAPGTSSARFVLKAEGQMGHLIDDDIDLVVSDVRVDNNDGDSDAEGEDE